MVILLVANELADMCSEEGKSRKGKAIPVTDRGGP
jgi:hypothetical protein